MQNPYRPADDEPTQQIGDPRWPSEEALRAMAAASGRARASTGERGAVGLRSSAPPSSAERDTAELPTVAHADERRPAGWAAPPPVQVARRAGRSVVPTRFMPRSWLAGAVFLVAGLVILAGLVDLGISLVRQSPPPVRATGAAATKAKHHSSSPGTRHTSAPTTTVATKRRHHRHHATPTTAGAPGAPHLDRMWPRGGRAGTVVVVHGTNLSSPNGVVLAHVDGQPTRTDCTTLTSCDVMIPYLPGVHGWVRLRITTASGTSNALSFHYRNRG